MVSSSYRRSARLPCAVILTALPVEYTAVKAHLSHLREQTHKGTVYESGNFSANNRVWRVVIAEVGQGNVPTALETQSAIERFKPGVILFVGVAGGLKDVSLGDVVAANKAYGYESGKAESTFQTRAEVYNSRHAIVQRARAEARKAAWRKRIVGEQRIPAPRAFVGPVAAGEKVVASTRSDTYKFLRRVYSDALAVEKEGRGFLEAAEFNDEVDALVVRGVSDLIQGKQSADAAGYQQIAARHAAAFAFQILAKLKPVQPEERMPRIKGPSARERIGVKRQLADDITLNFNSFIPILRDAHVVESQIRKARRVRRAKTKIRALERKLDRVIARMVPVQATLWQKLNAIRWTFETESPKNTYRDFRDWYIDQMKRDTILKFEPDSQIYSWRDRIIESLVGELTNGERKRSG